MSIHGYFRPDAPAQSLTGAVVIAESHVRFALSVQEEANLDHPITRGSPIPGTALCGEYLVNLMGRPVYGTHLRDDTATWEELQRRANPRLLGAHLAGFVGAGNATMNPRFIAVSAGRLFHVRGEDLSRPCPFLLSRSDGIAFESIVPGCKEPSILEGISGPQLVVDGAPADEERIARMAEAGWFYDLRHVLQFPNLSWPDPALAGEERFSIDVGLERFWREGRVDGEAVGAAIRGRCMEVDLRPYLEPIPRFGRAIGRERVRNALKSQGYVESRHPSGFGEHRLGSDRLEIVFYPGIYNHSLLGLDKLGRFVWQGLGGLGGRLGLTMADTARLAANHMLNGILVDNGGDVMCRIGSDWVLASAHGRERIRAIVLFLGDAQALTVRPQEVPLRPLVRHAVS